MLGAPMSVGNKPPPPPIGARVPGVGAPGRPPLPPPRPLGSPPAVAVGETASQALKDRITDTALGLLEEQVQARIVHYKAELETNPELDKVTEEVVAGLRQLQAAAAHTERGPSKTASVQVQRTHERILTKLLERVFPVGALSLLVERRLRQFHRNLARLFFESELHEKTRGRDGSSKVIQHSEQAIFYLLMRYEHRLKNELGGFDFADDEVKGRSFALLARTAKDMQDAFLSRRSSELKRIVGVFNAVLVELCTQHLAAAAAEIAREVVAQAATYEGNAYAYKVSPDAFVRFRGAFERRLMTRIVGFAEDVLVTRLADTAGAARAETLAFITDPQIFSMLCGELTDGVYELLCNEGFLELPKDWRATSPQRPSS